MKNRDHDLPSDLGQRPALCRRLAPLMSGLALSAVLGLGAAGADDTEIFFGIGGPKEINPNVLFVLDTSMSMNARGDSGETRLEELKQALFSMAENATDVNIGLMRFNGHDAGGAVIWPVVPLDTPMCAGTACEDVITNARIESDDGDVEQSLSSGAVSIDGYTLTLGHAESEPRALGLRFDALDLPQGATITSARLELVARHDSSGASELTISAEASDDAAPFTGAENDVSARLDRTASITWRPADWVADEHYQSGDLSAVIQAVVDRPGWCGGNAVALIVEGTGRRDALSWRAFSEAASLADVDEASALAPNLRVTYDAGSIPADGGCTRERIAVPIASGSDDAEEVVSGSDPYPDTTNPTLDLGHDAFSGDEQIVGLRFAGVDLPQGANIEEASIKFNIRARADEEALSLSVLGEDTAEAESHDAGDRAGISERLTLSETVSWANVPAPAIGETLSTPDIATLVQRIVDRPDWIEGGAMGFLIERLSGSGTRTVDSHEGGTSGPQLSIRYRTRAQAGESLERSAGEMMKEVVAEIERTEGAPIVDALYEAARYLRGDAVDYGTRRGKLGHPEAENRVSHEESWSGGALLRPNACTGRDLNDRACADEQIAGRAVYDSPMASACQSNHIVLLTSGQASSNSSAQKVRELTGTASCATDTAVRACGQQLAGWLAATDHAAHLPGTQAITTHTIGFDFSGSWIKSLAKKGGGEYHKARNVAELTAVFESLLRNVAAVDTSFVASGVTVNQFNRLTHRSDVYFSLFKPATRPRWSGNLKRYTIGGAPGGIEIRDANGDPAVDESTGFFVDTARSHWSDSVDGASVAAGGAALRIDAEVLAAGREVYTFTGDSASLGGSAVDLTLEAHALHEDNAALTEAMLGIDATVGNASAREAYRAALLEWARGVDVLDADEDGDVVELRAHMGDPMHSRPVLLNYNEDDAERSSIYVGTNEGFLHSIDSERGDENYAFVPGELLGNLDVFMRNFAGDDHPYGLDGTFSVRVEDANNNVAVDPGERAFLYMGMRRGGRNYYALDVSSRLAPKLAWVIEGGSGEFAELGQSWSRPVPARVMLEGAVRDVLVFGAGYDTAQDAFASETSPRRAADTLGRGFYIVDALTGERLWAALGVGASGADEHYLQMRHSVPGDIRVIDADFDGLADQLWFGDMGGQIWRFDIASYHQSGDARQFIDGGVMAELGGNLAGEERRFYYEPDVALIGEAGRRSLAISIGSGWRASPLDTSVEDRFYVLRSEAIYGAPEGYGRRSGEGVASVWYPITESDLLPVGGSVDPATSAHGWYFDLPRPGEKVLADSITVNGQVIFTTYRPELSPDPCTPSIGKGSVYVLDVSDGSATIDSSGDGEAERSTELVRGGIPPEPAALFTTSGPTVLVGPEQPVDVGFGNLTRRSYWVDRGTERPADAVGESP